MAGQDGNNSNNVAPADTSTANRSERGGQQGNKSRFRMTPREQEVAYEIKANMMRKLDEQNEKLETEILLNEKLKVVRKVYKSTESQKKYDTMTLANAVKLMRMYERKAKDAEERNKQLEEELKITADLARRYRETYSTSSGKNKARPISRAHTAPGQKTITDNRKLSDEDLFDDEAMFRRHVAKLVENKSMITTSPIRVQDVIRKNELLLEENATLQREVHRLKDSVNQLMYKAKHEPVDSDTLIRSLGASEDNRRELLKRLEKEQKQSRLLSKSLTRQATEWIHLKKSMQYQEDRNKMMNSVYRAVSARPYLQKINKRNGATSSARSRGASAFTTRKEEQFPDAENVSC